MNAELFNLNIIIPFIMIGLFLDVYIFHHFREDGDMFDDSDTALASYVNCCLCHGFAIGGSLAVIMFFHSEYIVSDILIGGCVVSISALTYNIIVLRE